MTSDSMPESYREAFEVAVSKTRDWTLKPSPGPEPECHLEGRPYLVSTFFDSMTKCAEPMPTKICAAVLEIMGGVREDERAEIERHPS
jgi:hypothetical protein